MRQQNTRPWVCSGAACGVGQGAGAFQEKLRAWMQERFETRDFKLQELESWEEMRRLEEEQAAREEARRRRFSLDFRTVHL